MEHEAMLLYQPLLDVLIHPTVQTLTVLHSNTELLSGSSPILVNTLYCLHPSILHHPSSLSAVNVNGVTLL